MQLLIERPPCLLPEMRESYVVRFLIRIYRVMGVEEAVVEENEVAGHDLVPAHLLHLALLEQLPARLNQLKVTNPTLQLQHLVHGLLEIQGGLQSRVS